MVCAIALFSFHVAKAADSATPQEIYNGVHRGVALLQSEGAQGLEAFNDPKGAFAWKDTYVQVYNCGSQQIVGHINPNLLKWSPEKFSSIVDIRGNAITRLICEAAEDPKGGWVEYWWPKAGETKPVRKVTYVLQVPGQPYQVSAGIYDEDMSLEELNKMIQK